MGEVKGPTVSDKKPSGQTSRVGRPLYENPDGSYYSEVTVTFPFEGKWLTFPSVDESGNILSEDEVFEYVKKNGPVDPITGETFPVFETLEDAESFARDRSKGLIDFNEGGLVSEDKTLEAFGMTRGEMEQANQQAADQMLPVPYDIPGEVGPVEEDRFGDTAAWAAKDSWEEAKARFQSRGTEEGVAGAIPEADSSVLNTFAAGLGYAADMGLSGLAASDAAWKYSVGLASELVPGMDKNQEQRFTRDVSSIPEAFAGNVTGVVGGIDRLPDVRQATTGARMVAEDVLDAMPEYDPNTLYSLGGVGSNKPKKTGPVKVPRLFQSGGSDLPSRSFGRQKLRDLFPEDDDFDVEFGEINFEPLDEGALDLPQGELGAAEVPRLGYTLNVRAHDLADLSLGRKSPEEILNDFGMDSEPHLISYLNEKVGAIKEKPEFQEYLEKYRGLNEPFDPSDAVSSAELPQGVVAQYRSPIPEVLDSLDYPESGIKGSQLLKSLQDSPSVRGSELSSLGVNIDPAKKYTQQEAQDLFRDKLWDVTARLDDPQFSTYQRQPVLDNVIDYFEITVNADRQVDPLTGMRMGPTFQANSQHFADSTLAHTRASIVDDGSYQGPYILVEELQSDLLQKGFGKPSEARPKKSPKDVLEESRDTLSSEGFSDEEQLLLQILGQHEYPRGNAVFYNPNTLLNFVDTVGAERLTGISDFDKLGEFYRQAPYLDPDSLLRIYINYLEGRHRLSELSDQGWDLYDRLQDAKIKLFEDSVTESIEESRGLPPIKRTEESVRLSLDALIAKAAQEGVSRIVIPPLDRIVAERFTPGTEDYFKALDPKSGFYATYVKSVDKVLKEYEKEFGRKNFLVEPFFRVDYEPRGYRVDGKVTDLSNEGTLIDISGLLKDYEVNMPQFSEGGLVSDFNEGGLAMERQMNTMMAEGGIKDSGMNRDPISGNEIPAGSLAKEVRDDVDAKLSEGEYVVPADVVRYFGVNYFEKLRQKAKAGLEEMDRDGRIGGDPVGEPMGDMDEALSDEEMFALNEMFKGGMVSGYAPGGDVTRNVSNQGFVMPQSVFGTAPAPAPTATPTTLYGPSGDVMVLMLPAEQERYNQLISEGYSTKPIEAPTTGGETETRSDRDRSAIATPQVTGGGQGGSPFSLDEDEIKNLSEDPLAFGKSALNPKLTEPGGRVLSGNTLGTVGMFVNPALGIAGAVGGTYMEMQNLAKARAALEVAKNQKLTDTPEYRSLESEVRSAEKEMSLASQVLDSALDFSGKNFVSQVQTPSSIVAPTTPQAIPTGGGGGDDRPNTWDGGQVASNQDKPDRDRSSNQAQEAAQAAADRQGSGSAYRPDGTVSGTGKAKGGLIQRPKKKPVAKK
jgi:hypothetical protein